MGPKSKVVNAHTDPKSAALKIAEQLLEMPGADPATIEDMIHDTLDMAVITSQGLKGLAGDARSAALFLERGDRRREERQRERAWALNTAEKESFPLGSYENPERLSLPRRSDHDKEPSMSTESKAEVEPQASAEPQPAAESAIRHEWGIPGPSGGEPFGAKEEPVRRSRHWGDRVVGRINVF
jgi:hypothetical protein